jgi:hypothetical protein
MIIQTLTTNMIISILKTLWASATAYKKSATEIHLTAKIIADLSQDKLLGAADRLYCTSSIVDV